MFLSRGYCLQGCEGLLNLISVFAREGLGGRGVFFVEGWLAFFGDVGFLDGGSVTGGGGRLVVRGLF